MGFALLCPGVVPVLPAGIIYCVQVTDPVEEKAMVTKSGACCDIWISFVPFNNLQKKTGV